MLLHIRTVYSFLSLNSIPLCGYSICFSMCWWVDTQAASSLGISQFTGQLPRRGRDSSRGRWVVWPQKTARASSKVAAPCPTPPRSTAEFSLPVTSPMLERVHAAMFKHPNRYTVAAHCGFSLHLFKVYWCGESLLALAFCISSFMKYLFFCLLPSWAVFFLWSLESSLGGLPL